MKKLNQYIFGAIMFAAQVSIVSSLVYVVFSELFLLIMKQPYNFEIIFYPLFFVFPVVFFCTFFAFICSVLLRKRFNLKHKKQESYYFLILAAVPANAAAFILTRNDLFTLLSLTFLLASLVTIYFGAIIYRKTWNTLDNLSQNS